MIARRARGVAEGRAKANTERGPEKPRTSPPGPWARAARTARGAAGGGTRRLSFGPRRRPPATPGGSRGEDEARKSAGFRAARRLSPVPRTAALRRLAPDAMS